MEDIKNLKAQIANNMIDNLQEACELLNLSEEESKNFSFETCMTLVASLLDVLGEEFAMMTFEDGKSIYVKSGYIDEDDSDTETKVVH